VAEEGGEKADSSESDCIPRTTGFLEQKSQNARSQISLDYRRSGDFNTYIIGFMRNLESCFRFFSLYTPLDQSFYLSFFLFYSLSVWSQKNVTYKDDLSIEFHYNL